MEIRQIINAPRIHNNAGNLEMPHLRPTKKKYYIVYV
jgi:hypothetical protein